MKITRLLSMMFGIVVLAAAIAAGLFFFRDMSPPLVSLRLDAPAIGRDLDVIVDLSDEGSGLRSVRVVAIQDQSRATLVDKPLDGARKAEVPVRIGDAPFRDGPITLEITAHDSSLSIFGAGGKRTIEQQLVLDTKKPVVNLESQFHNIIRGGSGLAVYTVDEDLRRSGMRVGEKFFPGYKLPDGRWACLFAFPWSMEMKDFQPVLIAEDKAGNTRERPIPFHPIDKQFRHDNINLSDNFLNEKMQQYESDFPGARSKLEIFLKVNSEMRKANLTRMREIGHASAPEILWKETFLRTEGKPMAGFADHRSYIYNGQKVDEQTHTGVDIADIAAAPVPAANPGRVVLAEFFGIYGNAVVIDHGIGLMTLYSHLSQINVQTGDVVTRGQKIGHTGATGMAGGDHLHYEVFVSGQSVSPFEWWDAHWIKDNFSSKLAK